MKQKWRKSRPNVYSVTRLAAQLKKQLNIWMESITLNWVSLRGNSIWISILISRLVEWVRSAVLIEGDTVLFSFDHSVHMRNRLFFQMINYIKTHSVTAESFAGINEVLWNDDKYLKPVEVDSWLMFGRCLGSTHQIWSMFSQLLLVLLDNPRLILHI